MRPCDTRITELQADLASLDTKHLQETDDSRVRLSRSCPPDSNLRSNGTRYSGRHSAVPLSDMD
jgi:hypothetical protein